MEKLNITEFLKDCPKGTKLYSPIFGDVYLDKIRPHLAIVVTTDKKQGDFKEEFLYDGRYGINGVCMLFPSKDKTTWEGFQRPFKNGDKKVYEDDNNFPSFEPMFKINGEIEYKIPDGYEITEVSKNKVFIKPIKSKYPTEYEECVRIAKNIHGYDIHVDVPAYGELMESFVKLLICRDAYWKIAGEQMGLDKPWDINCGGWGYWIGYDVNANKIYCQDSRILLNHLLVFPTEEMRDIFYRNFMDLIEQCKELL